jgi:NADH dehydrogenase/NADH:ubiquinone oxidoreductase subunit G
MADIRVVIDGKEVSGSSGMTILEAASEAGINIPTLCHRPDLTPEGNCRICVVEVEGSSRLVA